MSEKIIHLNEAAIKSELKELVRSSVEETLNELLEQEAQALTNAGRYERTENRQGYRSGHYKRELLTSSGEVTLKMPKLKGVTNETAIIERYRRRESSVERSMDSTPVVEQHVLGDFISRLPARGEVRRIHAFHFERTEETLRAGVVVRAAGTAHALKAAVAGHGVRKSAEAYWLPRSVWKIDPRLGLRFFTAFSNADMARFRSMARLTAQPTTRLEQMSSTVHRYSHPSSVRR